MEKNCHQVSKLGITLANKGHGELFYINGFMNNQARLAGEVPNDCAGCAQQVDNEGLPGVQRSVDGEVHRAGWLSRDNMIFIGVCCCLLVTVNSCLAGRSDS